MKLRNKKTGEIGDFNIECIKNRGNYLLLARNDVPYYDIKKENGNLLSYDTIAELNEEWEDYKPTEPLIKDEKIRNAVRVWAEACDVDKCNYDGDGDFATIWCGIKLDCSGEQLEEGNYTIAELCGEEEQCES